MLKKRTNYQKGKDRENYIKRTLIEKKGFDVVLRSAGSKGFSDLIAIKKDTKEILFVQVKPKKFSENAKNKLLEENDWANCEFKGRFVVM